MATARTASRPDREITRIYGDFEEGEFSKIFDNEDFGYWRITVERPLRLNFVVDLTSGSTGSRNHRGSRGSLRAEEGGGGAEG